MALFIALYRTKKTLDSSDWQSLREMGVPATVDTEPLPPKENEEGKPVRDIGQAEVATSWKE